MCGTMAGIGLVGVGAVSTSQRLLLHIFARNPHKGLAREISYETARGRGKATVRERRLLKQGVRTCGSRSQVRQRERVNFIRVLASDNHRMTEKCQNFTLHTITANPNPCLFVLSSTLGYICYVCCKFVNHLKYPWLGDVRNL